MALNFKMGSIPNMVQDFERETTLRSAFDQLCL